MAVSIMMLRCFAAVAQTGNLADAGSSLGRTQSAVSMALKQLEDHLGARLFETERKNRLTALGEEIFELARHQLHEFDSTVGAIETLADTPSGLLRIASVPSVVHQGLPEALDSLIVRHPLAQLDIRDADSAVVIDALLRGQADIGIVSGTPALNGVRQSLLFEDAFGLVCAPDNPLMLREEPPGFEDLTPSCFVRNNLCATITTKAFQQKLAEMRVTVRNTLSLISMVQTRNWVTVLPQRVVGILPGHLAFREIAGLTEYRQVSLLQRERCLYPELAGDLADILQAQDWHLLQALPV